MQWLIIQRQIDQSIVYEWFIKREIIPDAHCLKDDSSDLAVCMLFLSVNNFRQIHGNFKNKKFTYSEING